MVNHALPSSLVREGDMMLNAVASDFKAIPDVEVRVLRDYRLRKGSPGPAETVVWPGSSSIEKIEESSGWFEALLIIAPETDGVLSSLCKRFSGRGFMLLNSDIESIALTSNKYDTYKYLQAHGIPQIPTYTVDELQEVHSRRWVIKPVDGVGCEGLLLLPDRSSLERVLAKYREGRFIIQPFVEGTHASLSLVCRDGQCLQLSVNEQHLLERNGNLVLKGCSVNVFDSDRFRSFSEKLVRVLPGLRGYIGVDILVTRKETLLVEVNPRLTTSYIGLKSALGINPAKLMMECFTRQQLPRLEAVKDDAVTVTLEADRAA